MTEYTGNDEDEPKGYSCVRVQRKEKDARQKVMDAVESYLRDGVKVLEIFVGDESVCKVRKTHAGVWINPFESPSTFHPDSRAISVSRDIDK
ncbi:hypothetical protein HYW76_00015 [Candidatus Pacearchaeota archaeon]|nr:hypothetical protein [Candidatus Pacearchaeota archaeon]